MRLITIPKKVPLHVFTPELILAVPQVPTDIAESYIRQSAIDLVEQSHCLKRDIAIATQAGVSDYQLEPGDGTHTDKIDQVCDWLGRPYTVLPNKPCFPPCGVRCVDFCAPGTNGGLGTFAPLSPVVAWFEQPNEFHVNPVPQVDVDLGFMVKLSVIPDRDACDLDELLYQRYQPAIVAGALAYLYEMPDKAWTNIALSVAKRKESNMKTARALGDAMTGAKQGVHRMTTARFV
jgi:hypothetical protein